MYLDRVLRKTRSCVYPSRLAVLMGAYVVVVDERSNRPGVVGLVVLVVWDGRSDWRVWVG
jgi:hypothetical protein